MSDSLISVIVPVYNAQEFLVPCIDSILNQTYQKLELILVDDGSEDKSGAICDLYAQKDKRVHVVHQANEGVSVARNTGLQHAHGDYIGFVDSDDWIENIMYERMIAVLEELNVDAAQCGYYRYKSSGKSIKYGQDKILDSPEKISSHLICGGNVWSYLFKSKLVDEVFFDCDIERGEDWLFTYQALMKAEKILTIAEPFYHYRWHKSACTKQTFTKKNMHRIEAAKKIQQIDKRESVQKNIRCAVAWSTMTVLGQLVCLDDYAKVYGQLYRELKTDVLTERRVLMKKMDLLGRICVILLWCAPSLWAIFIRKWAEEE